MSVKTGGRQPGESVISCSVCLMEIPESAVFTPEGEEYVGHFCGLECYQEFLRARREAVEEQKGRNP